LTQVPFLARFFISSVIKATMPKVLSVVAILLITSLCAEAQSFYAIRRERNVLVSAGTGTSTYFGELQNPGHYFDFRPNVNVGLQVFLNRFISTRAELSWFRLGGSDANANDDRRERNLSFTSNNVEVAVTGLVNFFPNGKRFYQRSILNFYGFVGVGGLYFNPKTQYQGQKIALQPLETEGVHYSRFIPVIPYGLGLRIKQGPFFNICIEGGLRKTFTDYLDDASIERYPDPASLSSDLSRALSDRRGEYFESIGEKFTPKPGLGKRGNPKGNDGYFLLTVKVEYYLPYDLFGGFGPNKLFTQKRSAYERYNKRGGFKKKRNR
jgi:hypothetical protein